MAPGIATHVIPALSSAFSTFVTVFLTTVEALAKVLQGALNICFASLGTTLILIADASAGQSALGYVMQVFVKDSGEPFA